MKTARPLPYDGYVERFHELKAERGPVATNTGPAPELSDSMRQVFSAATTAWNRWANSPKGAQELQAMRHANPVDARLAMQDLVSGETFQEVRQLLQSLDLPFNSFSVGINFEVELILAFSGTPGGAIGIGDSQVVSASAFLSLGLDEGVEAGALAGVQFGLWKASPEDLGGWSIGGELIVDDELGGAIGASWNLSGSELQGVWLTLGVGVDDGGEMQESYTFILGGFVGFLRPVYQPRKTHFLILTQLYCENPSTDGGHNEVYFTFQADSDTMYYYPTYDYFAMAEGDTWYCGRSVMFDESIAITLWDEDTGGDTNLGSCSISYSQLTAGQEVKFTISSSHGLDERVYYLYAKLIY
ncbi:MAG: hypothetical protein KDA69_15240 [Planctomycetaceae bacterium]|nr:hypothetical protein [Planctomycetaceae bacterium]